MKPKIFFVSLLFAVMNFMSFPSLAQSASPQETLQQYVADLQKNPDDNALREKIIKFAQEMKPAPTLSDEARIHLDRGVAAVEGAKSEEDFKDASAEFTQVVNSAPWFGGGYRPLAIAQDKAGQYDAALKNLEFYLLSQPSAEDAAWAKSLMNKIEYRKEKAAKESSPEVVAAKKETDNAEWLKKLDGARYIGQGSHGNDMTWENELVIRGTILTWRQRITYYGPNEVRDVPLGQWFNMDPNEGRMQIVGREAKRLSPFLPDAQDTFTISEDGSSITGVDRTTGTFMLYRQ